MEKTYTYKGKDYQIENEATMKNFITRQWQPCIIYIQLESGLRFVREKDEFFQMFKSTV